MEPLGPLLRRLREERRWPQSELARLSGYSVDVIAKVEQGRANWSTRTARAVFTALATKEPLSEGEAHDFMVQSRLTESLGGRLFNDVYLDLLDKGHIRAPGTSFVAPEDRTPAAIDRLLKDALERFGPDRVEMMLRTMYSLADMQPPAASPASPTPETPEARALRVEHAPFIRPDGHIEQHIEEVILPPPTAPAAPAKSAPGTLRKPKPSAGA